MASMFKALSNAVVSTLNTVTDVAISTNAAVGIGTHRINEYALKDKELYSTKSFVSMAVELKELQLELEQDDEVNAIYERLMKKHGRNTEPA